MDFNNYLEHINPSTTSELREGITDYIVDNLKQIRYTKNLPGIHIAYDFVTEARKEIPNIETRLDTKENITNLVDSLTDLVPITLWEIWADTLFEKQSEGKDLELDISGIEADLFDDIENADMAAQLVDMPLILDEQIFDLTDTTIESNIIVRNGGGITGTNIVIEGEIFAAHEQIFFGDLILDTPSQAIYGHHLEEVSYELTTTSRQTIRPEWWGTDTGEQSILEDRTLIESMKNPRQEDVALGLNNTDAFYSMYAFIRNNTSQDTININLNNNETYLTGFQHYGKYVHKLQINGNNASLANLGINSPFIGGQNFYHTMIGYGVKNPILPVVDYDAYKVTSLSGRDIYRGSNKLLGNSDAGYEIGDRVFLGSWQKYAQGWPPSMKEYSYHTIVDLQETVSGLEIELYPKISDTHYLNSPYSGHNVKIGRSTKVPITEIGVPRLYKLENHTTFFQANDLTVLPNLLMGNSKEVRTMLHMSSVSLGGLKNLQFKPYDLENPDNNFANLQFLNQDTKARVYSVPSNGNMYKYVNVSSTDPDNKIEIENDKNINAMFMFNINNASITGNTGIKRLYIKDSNIHRFDIASEQVKFIGSNTIERLNSWSGHSIVRGFENVAVTSTGYYTDNVIFKNSNLFSYDDNKLYIYSLKEMRKVAAHLFKGKTVSVLDTDGNELVTGTINNLVYYDRLDGGSNFIYQISWNGLVPQNIDTWLRINRAVRYL